MAAFDAARLRAVRESRGLTGEELARLSGKSYAVITMIENGTIPPSSRTLGRLAAALNATVSDFYDPAQDNDPVAAYDAELRAIVATMPPLDDDQRRRLGVLLSGGLP